MVLREEISESDADDDASGDRRPQPATPRSSTRSGTPRPRRHRGRVGAALPELDQVTALKKQLQYLQQQLNKQSERTEQKHPDQLKQAERRNKHLQEEHKSDLHEVKTKFEKHQRQQMREHEDNISELTTELRQASTNYDRLLDSRTTTATAYASC